VKPERSGFQDFGNSRARYTAPASPLDSGGHD